ncbi:MAG: T9SS type A sorting domain-containing protein [bacterium]|nr:T9SS type A sorting domain-containing protein [bacterium]
MKFPRLIAILVLCLALFGSKSYAAGGDHPWSDSLRAKTALDGPSLQELLSTLGYSINVATDEMNASVFLPQLYANQAEITIKHRGSASISQVGWYPKGNAAGRSMLFAENSPAGTTLTMPTMADSVGFYIGPTLYDDIWYSQTNLNWDAFDHAKVFSAGEVGHYVVAFEDLADGGDQDFEDVVIDLRFINPDALSLSFEGQTFYLYCTEQNTCFNVNAEGGVGNLTLEQKVGNSFTTVATGLAPIDFESCFLPWPIDSTHRFIFRITDEANVSITDTFSVRVEFRTNPELTLTDDYIDTTICVLDSICLDVAEAFDWDNDQLQFTLFQSPEANIDTLTGEVCFLPGALDSAMYQFIIVAYDSCCKSFGFPIDDPREILPCPRDTLTVIVRYKQRPVITTIPDTTVTLCKNEPATLCFPVTAAVGETAVAVAQECGIGTISNGELCFEATTSGTYTFCFSAADECGGFVRDTVKFTVLIDDIAPIANAGRDSTVTLCAPQAICWSAGCSSPTNDMATCEMISGPGTFNGSQICFTPTTGGSYQFVLRSSDECGNFDLDTAVIAVTLLNPPVALVKDTTVVFCVTQQVCIPASCSDPDGDLASCQLIGGPGSYNGGNICFTPDTTGTYRFILRATDACGASDLDTGFAVVTLNRRPDVLIGGGNFTLCEPGQICVPINASDPDGNPLTYTTTMGTINGNTVCINSGASGSRVFNFNVIARDACGAADTALYTVNVRVNMVPVITVPSPTPQNLCAATQLCFNVTTVDTIVTKLTYSLLSGPGTINATTGQVCFTPTADGTFNWSVLVADSCGKADTGLVSWNINFIDPPTAVVAAPDGDTAVCVGTELPSICAGITYTNTPNTTITVSPTNSSVDFTFTYANGAGTLCFDPILDHSQTYSFEFIRSNECGVEVATTWDYEVRYDDCDSSCIVLQIEKTECVTLGSQVTVGIDYEGRLPIGGYDMLIKYDVSAFSFVNATIGPAISGWEYFTYRLGPFGNCTGSCPGGLVRVVAIADANNGANHPPVGQLSPSGTIANITFRVTSNNTFEGQVLPVEFFWIDCGDNAFSSLSGDTLLVDKIIYDSYDVIIWDEDDNVGFPEASRFEHLGVPDTCIKGDKFLPERCIELRNGFICIIDNDSIDARGDMNLNGIPNEIADAVLYTNYFLKGVAAFTISVAGQTAASDINADGHTLTIGDLVYLLRVLIGDVQPIPKLAPFANSVEFSIEEVEGTTRLWSNSSVDLGGVYLRAKLNGADAATVVAELAAQSLELAYSTDGDVLNVVMYSDELGAKVNAGERQILTIGAEVTIEHIEAADYDGNLLNSSLGKTVLPEEFALIQNYPNPFNPETTISFSLPKASEWTMTILNISGQIVKRLSGSSPAGVTSVVWDATDQAGATVATGVYLYRLDAGEFSSTRKMVLMK